jgi:hypothetical protein
VDVGLELMFWRFCEEGREALLGGLGGNDGLIFVCLFVDAERLGSLLEVDMDGC